MDCERCIHFKLVSKYEYTCKYIDSKDVGFEGDSIATAEMCKYYKEK